MRASVLDLYPLDKEDPLTKTIYQCIVFGRGSENPLLPGERKVCRSALLKTILSARKNWTSSLFDDFCKIVHKSSKEDMLKFYNDFSSLLSDDDEKKEVKQ